MGEFVVVIPARYASVRLPGKPLRLIAGEPMIQHVHRAATRTGAREVWIATDDERIEAAARQFGANVDMVKLRGLPSERLRPFTSVSRTSIPGNPEPIAFFTRSAVASPINMP